MKIAIEGCAHGELDNIYESLLTLEQQENIKIDLLICCGDFQASRNPEDLSCMAVPAKYNDLRTFYKYYNGEKKAPVLTIFIGGNHEASNYLQELPYGGWVAPNIYYLGYASIVNIGGIRIGGISGIYKGRDYMKGHYEKTPYNDETKRSVYHVRNLEVFRFKQTSQPIDICLSHDWPSDIFKYGDVGQLLRYKPFFKDDIESEKIGNPPCQEILEALKPTYWFAAHLHCKFAALVNHEDDSCTKFLALDKCLPNKRFLQIIDVAHDTNIELELQYDLEWLTVLYLTNHLLSVKNTITYMPGPNGNEKWNFNPTQEDLDKIQSQFGDLKVPNNFVKTADAYNNESPSKSQRQPSVKLNPQTKTFCSKLGVDDPMELLLKMSNVDLSSSIDMDSISDSSFLNDSNLNLSVDMNNSDFIRASPMQRTSLNIPQPKNSELYFSFEDNSFEDTGLSEEAIREKEGQNEHVKNSEKIQDAKIKDIQELDVSGYDSCSSPVKKMKRRNANIYDKDICL